jgi:hypothetical protein
MVTVTVGDLGVCIVIYKRGVSICQRCSQYVLADSLWVVVLLSEDALEGKRTVESIDLVDGLRTRSPRLLAVDEETLDCVRLVLTDGTDKYGDGAGATLPASD